MAAPQLQCVLAVHAVLYEARQPAAKVQSIKHGKQQNPFTSVFAWTLCLHLRSKHC